MADRLTPTARTAVMRAVKGRDTAPELQVRRMLHAAGYRYRVQLPLYRKRPDIVFTLRRQVVFVHGCFWHGHDCPRGALPTSNASFWYEKIARNRQRDGETVAVLAENGWTSLVIWECELRHPQPVAERMRLFLGVPVAPPRRHSPSNP